MRAIFYDPGDARLIELSYNFLGHVAQCPNCQRIAQQDGREYVQALFQKLNSITSEDIPLFDYGAGMAFCAIWMDRHNMLLELEALEHPVGSA